MEHTNSSIDTGGCKEQVKMSDSGNNLDFSSKTHERRSGWSCGSVFAYLWGLSLTVLCLALAANLVHTNRQVSELKMEFLALKLGAHKTEIEQNVSMHSSKSNLFVVYN